MAKIVYEKDDLTIYYPDKLNDVRFQVDTDCEVLGFLIDFDDLKKVVKKIEDSKGE